jgi:hypothetical protein
VAELAPQPELVTTQITRKLGEDIEKNLGDNDKYVETWR